MRTAKCIATHQGPGLAPKLARIYSLEPGFAVIVTDGWGGQQIASEDAGSIEEAHRIAAAQVNA